MSGGRWARAAVVGVAGLVALSAPARAEVTVALDYATAAGLTDCPTAVDFQRAVIHQLGRDPFRDDAPRRVLVRLYATGARMAGRLEWRDADDQWEGERTFSSRNEGCAAMGRAMALATAIQIQLLAGPDLGALAPPEPAPPPVAPAPSAVLEIPAAPASPAVVRRRWAVTVDAGAGVIQDAGGSPLFAVPRLAVSVIWPSSFGVRLAASGLGPDAEVAGVGGSAALNRLVTTLAAVRFFRAERRVQPFVTLGVGWQDVRVQGASAMPSAAPAHAGQVFSALAAASGGVALVLAPRIAVVAEVEALAFRPSTTIEIGGASAGHLDGAAVFAHGGVLARF